MKLTAEQRVYLGLSPLYVIYAVTAPQLSPAQVEDVHVIRAVEQGLVYRLEFSTLIFDLFKSNLHKFHAHLLQQLPPAPATDLLEALSRVRTALDALELPAEQREDFTGALHALAEFVAAGRPFGPDFVPRPEMRLQAERIGSVLNQPLQSP